MDLIDRTHWRLALDRDDTAVLKAVAMAGIVAHSFLHQVSPAPLENEFNFYGLRAFWRMLSIAVAYPAEIPHVVLSFLGHYGVVLFVFLSGYGLTRRYMASAPGIRTAAALSVRQIVKMLCLIAVGSVLVIAWRFITEGRAFSLVHELTSLASFLSFTNNLRPDELWGFVSVWWFFALIIQLYVLYPVLVMGVEKHPGVTFAIALVSLGAAQWFGPEAGGISFFATPLSHGLIFLFGIWLAMGLALPRALFSWVWAVLVLSQIFSAFFALSFTAVLLCVLDLYDRWGRRLKTCRSVVWFGQLSSFVFLVHGWMREPMTRWLDGIQAAQFAADKTFQSGFTLEVFLLWFAGVLVMSVAAKRLYRPVFGWAERRFRKLGVKG